MSSTQFFLTVTVAISSMSVCGPLVNKGALAGGVVGEGGCGDGAGATCHLGSQAPFSTTSSTKSEIQQQNNEPFSCFQCFLINRLFRIT